MCQLNPSSVKVWAFLTIGLCAVSSPAFADSSTNSSTEVSSVQADAGLLPLGTAQTIQPLMLSQVIPAAKTISTIERLIVNPYDPPPPLLPDPPPPQSLGQVTSISQLSDAQPTDWAYQALQSLVEKYGCIAGYPDGTFRGNRAATRFELAAALNACLDVISDRFATQEDLETVRKLQQELAAELATIRGRVDSLEARTARLEAQQFSTTTKLFGVANVWLAGATNSFSGDSNNPLVNAAFGDNNPVVQYRTILNLLTSFTGKDLLATTIIAGNVPPLATGFNLPGEVVAGLPIASAEGTLATQFAANSNNQPYLATLQYTFPFGKKLSINAVSNIGYFNSIVPVLNPYLGDGYLGTGSISAFGQGNAIYALGSGTGLNLNFHPIPQVQITASYLSDFLSAPNTNRGFIGGGYAALGQVTWRPTKKFSVAATYIHSYFLPGRFGFNYNALNIMGTAVANTLAGQTRLALNPELFNLSAVNVDSYGGEFTYQVNPRFTVSGWFGASFPTLLGRGNGQILNYAVAFAFPDLGRQGNLLGVVVGAEPYLTNFNGGNPQPFKVDVPLHLEAFYKYQVNPGISVTPGFIVLTAPNQDNSNPTAFIGTVRTTFTF